MYWSKSSGRDRVSVYSPDTGEALSPEEKAEHAQRSSLVRTVHALARAVDAKDGYTHLHSQRVAFYGATLAVSLELDPERVEMIRTATVGRSWHVMRRLNSLRSLCGIERNRIGVGKVFAVNTHHSRK